RRAGHRPADRRPAGDPLLAAPVRHRLRPGPAGARTLRAAPRRPRLARPGLLPPPSQADLAARVTGPCPRAARPSLPLPAGILLMPASRCEIQHAPPGRASAGTDEGRAMDDVLGFILGGGRGPGLYPLTKHRSTPAVSVAGQYRLI